MSLIHRDRSELKLVALLCLACALGFAWNIAQAEQSSVCFGTPAKGRLEHARQLPSAGKNFSAYSWLGVTLGRTYVHDKVYATVLDAYRILSEKAPDKYYVYGETGWSNGGKFRPHKTHQNGLSVDFFVPVLDRQVKSTPLPTGMLNKFGYDIEFDNNGRYGDYVIDFTALAEHLWALKEAAAKQRIGIRHVIFDNELQKLLFQTPQGAKLSTELTFSKKKPWIKHDEHYHVDFIVPCESM